MIKTELMMEKIWSEQLNGRMTFKALTPIYLADLKIQRERFSNWITNAGYQGSKGKPATVNRELVRLKQLLA